MARIASDVLMVLVALINGAPVIGVLSRRRLESAYAVAIDGHDLAVLLRHRALTFGLLGVVIVWGLIDDAVRPVAYVVAGASMLGFVALAFAGGRPNAQLTRIAAVDGVGLILLACAIALHVAG